MGSEVKVEIVHKETIRPSSPTPHHLRFFSLSIFDQLSPELYFPLLLFYPNNSDHHEVNNVDHQHSLDGERTKLLKRSLSETLTRFYPFAGRILNNASVCYPCSFISRVLDKHDLELLKKLIPLGATKGDTGYDVLLVQINFFECGGITIGFNASHKIIDAHTLSTFINSWAAIPLRFSTSDNIGVVVHQQQYIAAASLFPPLDFFSSPPPIVEFAIEKCTTRRLLFESSKISCLKSEAVSAAVQNPYPS
ncbi:putative salutaridinol 7-O-acetyltransferase [Rosa chinensis]|uniref:Putative salutaridinol 7-O-acetyltransferase n=1 Tax=Rosa chinensis TaxID=74649 RepID=A0A2P6Q8X5_ROSCH|nr:putative salutaridinol 7-O-acetyltransferase [Rosa chinensis]